MRSFHIKSILLGIGIGIVVTSMMSMIYFSGTNAFRELTDDEIIERAVMLGMVNSNEFLSGGVTGGKVAADGNKDGKTADNEVSGIAAENTAEADGNDSSNASPSSTGGSVKIPDLQEADPASPSPESGKAADEEAAAEPDAEPDDEESAEETDDEEAVVVISRGDTSEIVADKLLAAGIINDRDEFLKQINNLRLTGAIDVGEFSIRKDASVRTVIKAITGK